MNARLALSVEKAKAENMPKDNITRAIKRGTGEIQGADYEEISYEGYAPNGIAIFVDALTDNTNRTVSDLRVLFSKAGGQLGNSGSVAFLFDQKGVFELKSEGLDELELFELVADAGAEDLVQEDDQFVVTTPVEAFGAVQAALEAAGISVEEAGLQRIPTMTKALPLEEAQKVAALLEKIEEHQDIQTVNSTLEFDEELVASLG
jgi:YebC/PmpR family DNA-binding regulatory protein